MDLSVDWPSPSLRVISLDCQDTVASTTSSSLNNLNNDNSSAAGGREVSPYFHNPRQMRQKQTALQERHRVLTEEIIQLKFNIATQRGRQDELHFDWQKLIPERNALQEEMESTEQECDTLQEEILETKNRIQESTLRLRQLTSITSPEQQTIDQVTNDFVDIDSEIKALQKEKISIQDISKNLSDEIEEYKRHAARLSSEISEIDIDRIAVQFDIDDLHEAINKTKATIREYKSAIHTLDTDIACVKSECVKLGKRNSGLEMKVSACSSERTSSAGGK